LHDALDIEHGGGVDVRKVALIFPAGDREDNEDRGAVWHLS
jgi:hypothetical protein